VRAPERESVEKERIKNQNSRRSRRASCSVSERERLGNGERNGAEWEME